MLSALPHYEVAEKRCMLAASVGTLTGSRQPPQKAKTGYITPTITWLLYADHQLDTLGRSLTGVSFDQEKRRSQRAMPCCKTPKFFRLLLRADQELALEANPRTVKIHMPPISDEAVVKIHDFLYDFVDLFEAHYAAQIHRF